MPKVTKYDASGARKGDVELNDVVFAAPRKDQAVHEALLRQLANGRSAHPRVKGYSDTVGGGGKPFRQKGTGRARMGTMRSSLRRGGAVTLGPNGLANHVIKLPRKVRRAALRSLLSMACRTGKLSVVENVQFEEPKTKKAVELLAGLEFSTEKVLFVLPERDSNFEKSVRNLPLAKALLAGNLNPHDLLHYERIVMFEAAVEKVVEVLS